MKESYTYVQLTDKLELKCSARTFHRILLGVDWLVYTKMDYTVPLTRKHKKARQLLAKSHVMMGTDWDACIFSDEKKFNFDGPYDFKKNWSDLRSPPRKTVRRQNGGG